MNTAFKYVLVLTIAALGLACGDDADEGASGSGGTAGSGGSAGSSGEECGTGVPEAGSACHTCLKANCDTEAAQCLGAGWQTGDWTGGDCEAQFTCLSGCDCDDDACGAACILDNLDDVCTACNEIFGECQTTECESECAGSGEAGTGGGAGTGGADSGVAGIGGGTACADLAECCPTLTGDGDTEQCLATVQAGVAQLCQFAAGMFGCP